MSAKGRWPGELQSADIAFTAEVRAERLRFPDSPETSTRFTGVPAHESGSGSHRVNLPEHVEKDVTYRNVRVGYWLFCEVIYPGPPGPGGAS